MAARMATPCPGVSDEGKAPQGTVSGGRGAVGGTAAGLTKHLELERSGLLAAYMCHPGQSRTSSLLCLGLVPVGLGRTASLAERLQHILVARVPGVCAGGWDLSLSQGTALHCHYPASCSPCSLGQTCGLSRRSRWVAHCSGLAQGDVGLVFF